MWTTSSLAVLIDTCEPSNGSGNGNSSRSYQFLESPFSAVVHADEAVGDELAGDVLARGGVALVAHQSHLRRQR